MLIAADVAVAPGPSTIVAEVYRDTAMAQAAMRPGMHGYTYENKVLVENRAEQDVVRLFRELRAGPLRYEKVARYLNSQGIPPTRAGADLETVKAVCNRVHAAPVAVSRSIPAESQPA